MNQQISVILPAFNEEKYIKTVLETIHTIHTIEEIIVIDDGSTDKTGEQVKGFAKVKYHKLEINQGKTRAVKTGIEKAKNEIILTLDADLVNLNREDIEKMIEIYQCCEMVILDYGGIDWIRRKIFKAFPALSGIRIFKKTIFEKIEFRPKGRFELEHRLNYYHLKNKKSIKVVSQNSIKSPIKIAKYGFLKGILLEIKALLEIFFCDGIFRTFHVMRDWRRIARLS